MKGRNPKVWLTAGGTLLNFILYLLTFYYWTKTNVLELAFLGIVAANFCALWAFLGLKEVEKDG